MLRRLLSARTSQSSASSDSPEKAPSPVTDEEETATDEVQNAPATDESAQVDETKEYFVKVEVTFTTNTYDGNTQTLLSSNTISLDTVEHEIITGECNTIDTMSYILTPSSYPLGDDVGFEIYRYENNEEKTHCDPTTIDGHYQGLIRTGDSAYAEYGYNPMSSSFSYDYNNSWGRNDDHKTVTFTLIIRDKAIATDEEPPEPPSDGISPGVLIAIISGSVVATILIAAVSYYMWRRHKNKRVSLKPISAPLAPPLAPVSELNPHASKR